MRIKEYTVDTFEKHLQEEHKLSPVSSYLKEIVYGGTDGIVTTFAVVAGFNGAQGNIEILTIPYLTVLLFGIANLFGDGISMALGNVLSVKANKDVYRKEKTKERHEIRISPQMERAETQHILISKGFTKEQAEKLTEIYSQNENYWVEFMMRNELDMSNPEGENPLYTGIATLISFVLFGIIPLFPYIFHFQPTNLFKSSIMFTFTALFLLGFLRYKATKEHPLRSIGEVILLGSISSSVAYLVGSFFRG